MGRSLKPAPTGLLGVRLCLMLALAAVLTGLAVRLAKPVDPPDPGFIERVETWKRLAAELEAGHHRERVK